MNFNVSAGRVPNDDDCLLPGEIHLRFPPYLLCHRVTKTEAERLLCPPVSARHQIPQGPLAESLFVPWHSDRELGNEKSSENVSCGEASGPASAARAAATASSI